MHVHTKAIDTCTDSDIFCSTASYLVANMDKENRLQERERERERGERSKHASERAKQKTPLRLEKRRVIDRKRPKKCLAKQRYICCDNMAERGVFDKTDLEAASTKDGMHTKTEVTRKNLLADGYQNG